MDITPELLRKYAVGKCSETERLAVETWLKSNETSSQELSDTHWKQAEQLMWDNLQELTSHRNTPVIPLYKKWSRYITAACLLLALSGAVYFAVTTDRPHPSQTIVSTAANSTRHLVSSGIAFTLFAGTNARIESTQNQSGTAVKICGKMEMIAADEYKEAEIFAACNGRSVSKKLFLEKGNKYLVFTKNNKVVVVDYAALRLLSPFQKARIMHNISSLKVS